MEIPVSARWAKTEECWAPHRDVIERLYVEENKTLKEVMEKMERDYHFKATVKMYKTKIGSWGLDKKYKENEVRAMIRKKTVRAALGKPSEFRIRGRFVNMRKVDEYLKRKQLLVADAVLRQISYPSSPPGLECFTPTDVPSSPRIPPILEVPEHIFVNVRNYFLGSFGAGTWVSEGDISDCVSIRKGGREMTTLKRLFSQHDVACHLFDKRSFKEAGTVLRHASTCLKEILSAEHPRTLGVLFDLIMYLRNRGRPEIALILLKHVAALAAVVLPSMHPIGQICAQLSHLSAAQMEEVLIKAWSNALEILRKRSEECIILH